MQISGKPQRAAGKNRFFGQISHACGEDACCRTYLQFNRDGSLGWTIMERRTPCPLGAAPRTRASGAPRKLVTDSVRLGSRKILRTTHAGAEVILILRNDLHTSTEVMPSAERKSQAFPFIFINLQYNN